MMALQMRKMPDMEEFRVLLKEHGLKSTHQRLAVHEAMMRLGHASADMVTEEIRKAGTVKVTVASVYSKTPSLAIVFLVFPQHPPRVAGVHRALDQRIVRYVFHVRHLGR